jgi:hypothetical protein
VRENPRVLKSWVFANPSHPQKFRANFFRIGLSFGGKNTLKHLETLRTAFSLFVFLLAIRVLESFWNILAKFKFFLNPFFVIDFLGIEIEWIEVFEILNIFKVFFSKSFNFFNSF